MLKGSTAPFFWGEVILGFVIPLAILLFSKNRQKTGLVIFSSVLVVIGVLFKRIWLLFTSFIHQHVEGAPGITLGQYIPSENPAINPNFWLRHGQYTPTLIELMIIVGMIAFGTLLFIVLSRKILSAQSKDTAPSYQNQAVKNSTAV
jgi:molybdopterin-containing oxidoreductase family membrane subunit